MTVKPCKNVQLAWFIWYSVAVILVMEILGIIFSNNLHEFLMGNLVLLGFLFLGLVAYILIRLCYRTYYQVTAEGVKKYKGKKEVFCIKKEQILEIGYTTIPLIAILFFPFYIFFDEPLSGIVSFRYDSCDLESNQFYDSMVKLETLTQEEKAKGIKECCDYLTKREAKKIGEILGLPLKEILKK